MRNLFLLFAVGLAVLLAGCGGKGGGSTPSATTRASTTFRIYWPTATEDRFIPANANYVEITLAGPSTPPTQHVVKTSGEYGTLTFSDLAAGDYVATAKAYQVANTSAPNTTGLTPISSGQIALNLDYGDNPQKNIALGGTLSRIRVAGLDGGPVEIDASNANAADTAFDLNDASEDFIVTPETIVNGSSAALLLSGDQFSVSNVTPSFISVAQDATDKFKFTITRNAGYLETSGSLNISYAADGNIENQRFFNLKFRLANSVAGSGDVTIDSGPGINDAATAGLATFDATLVETNRPSVATDTGVTYPGIPDSGFPSNPRKFRFAAVANNGKQFYVRYSIRLKSPGGFVDYVQNANLTSQPIAFSGSSLGSTTVATGTLPTLSIPAQPVAFKRGQSAGVTGVQAQVAGGSSILLTPDLFTATGVANSNTRRSTTVVQTPALVTVSATDTAVVDNPYSGTFSLASTYLNLTPTTSPVTVSITPNGGHVGVGVN